MPMISIGFRRSAVSSAAALLLSGCGGDGRGGADSSASATSVSAGSSRFTRDDFARLHWLEGEWRGRMANGSYFYERYKFVDDSTIAMAGFEDADFSHRTDSATIALRNGAIVDRGSGAPWSATSFDASSIAFARGPGSASGFTWTRNSSDQWTATLRSGQGNPTVYRMERVSRK